MAYELLWATFWGIDAVLILFLGGGWPGNWQWLQVALAVVALSAMWLRIYAAWDIVWSKPVKENR
jgi:hypothetical protein